MNANGTMMGMIYLDQLYITTLSSSYPVRESDEKW